MTYGMVTINEFVHEPFMMPFEFSKIVRRLATIHRFRYLRATGFQSGVYGND